MTSGELSEADAETVRRFRKRPWGEWTKTVVFVVAVGGPFFWARIIAPTDQAIIFLVFVIGTLGLFSHQNTTSHRHRYWMYGPVSLVIRRNVLCHLGRLDIEPPTEPSEANQHEGAFENASTKRRL